MSTVVLYLPTFVEFVKWIMGLWLGFELLFYFVVLSDWKRAMDKLTATPKYRLDPEVLIHNILNDVEALESLKNYSAARFLEGWFLGSSLCDVKRGIVIKFTAQGLLRIFTSCGCREC